MISKDELAKWKHLCREATPGPWYHVQVANWWEVQHGSKYEDTRLTDDEFDNRAEYNSHLMAESRTAIPKLLDEIERLQAELERVERELVEKDVEGVCNLCGKRFPSSAFW